MPTLVILLYFQMWMPSSSSMWLGGGQTFFSTNQESNEFKVFIQNISSTQCWKLNLANPFFSDKGKLYTKQEGCHGVHERVGQDL